MRILTAAFMTAALLVPSLARAAETLACSELPQAQAFVEKLHPGPNTRAAQHHLDAAKNATSDQQCVAELRQVDVYARRSAAIDRRMAGGRHRLRCADAMHQNRPGGSDYHGPPVAGCR